MIPYLKKQFCLISVIMITLMTLMALPAQAEPMSPEMIKKYSSMDPFSFVLLEFGFIVTLALIG